MFILLKFQLPSDSIPFTPHEAQGFHRSSTSDSVFCHWSGLTPGLSNPHKLFCNCESPYLFRSSPFSPPQRIPLNSLSFLKVWPIHFHFLCFVDAPVSSCPVVSCSPSFITFSQKTPRIWQSLVNKCLHFAEQSYGESPGSRHIKNYWFYRRVKYIQLCLEGENSCFSDCSETCKSFCKFQIHCFMSCDIYISNVQTSSFSYLNQIFFSSATPRTRTATL